MASRDARRVVGDRRNPEDVERPIRGRQPALRNGRSDAPALRFAPAGVQLRSSTEPR